MQKSKICGTSRGNNWARRLNMQAVPLAGGIFLKPPEILPARGAKQ